MLKPWEIPSRRRRIVPEAARELLRAFWLVRFRPFDSYAPCLGSAHPGRFSGDDLQGCPDGLDDIRWSIEGISRASGGVFTCLMQAMAGRAMLGRRGIGCTIVLGVTPDGMSGVLEANGVAAHAWLYVGHCVVLGGEAGKGFVPLTSFHSDGTR